MANNWTYDTPTTLVFENAAKSQVLTITNTGSGEFTINLKKAGTDKGTISMDLVTPGDPTQDIKDMFEQVGAAL